MPPVLFDCPDSARANSTDFLKLDHDKMSNNESTMQTVAHAKHMNLNERELSDLYIMFRFVNHVPFF